MLPFRRFIAALLAIGLVFGIYALLVAPWLEPPAVEKPPYSDKSHDRTDMVTVRNIDDLFEDGSWELDDPKVIETASCTMLLRDYKPLPDGRLEIKPCTLIFYMTPTKEAVAIAAKIGSKDPARRRVVMRALDGAILQFDRPLDLGKAEFGQITAGQLKGAIQIFSQATSKTANDALEITTSGVQIDRQKIYTPYAVDFKYGASKGRGRDLTVNLLPASEEKGARTRSLGGVSYLQLSQIESLHLEEAGGLLTGVKSAPQRGAKAAKHNPPLDISCRGALVVDLDNAQATLDDQVVVTRLYEQGPPDRLTCDRLVFRLKPRGRKTAASSKKDGKYQGTDAPRSPGSDTEFASSIVRIIATGTPAIIDAPQSGLYAKAASMDYTLATRVVRLNNGPTGAPVILRQGKNKFESRAIEYEAAEAGRLGKLFASGPGELEFMQDNGESVQASWRKSLHIRPHEGSQAISLLESAHITGAMGTFDAAELHLWVKELPRTAKQVSKTPSNTKPSFALAPERMLAKCQLDERRIPLNRVEIDSPQLTAKTNELQVWFAEATRDQTAEATPQGVPGVPEVPGFSKANDDQPAEQTPPTQKLSVSGDLVQLKILRVKGKPAVEDLAISGSVKVEEIQTERPDDVPLKLSGDAVTLVRGSGPSAKLEVKGRPAQVSARGLTLSGATIHLHRGENRLWIDGPGEADLPVPQDGLQMPSLQAPPGESPASLPTRLPAARAQGPTRQVKVTWASGMNFDGLKASFEGKVQVRGEGEYAAAEILEVTLLDRIDFTAPKQPGSAEIALLTLAGGKSAVVLQQIARDKDGEQTSFDNLRTGKLTINRQANTLTAEGPGEVWSVRKDMPGLMPGAEEVAPADVAKPDDGMLTYICVKFAGGISGKLDKHEIRFERQVETTYGRVRDWKDRLVATRVEDLGASGAHMKSEALTVTEMALSKTQKWVELEATGNVIVEGKSFTAQAARIGYTTDKEQLVMEGDGRTDAEFWHQATPGSQHSHTAAGKIRFQRKTGTLEVGDGRTLTLGSLPPSNTPLPMRRKLR